MINFDLSVWATKAANCSCRAIGGRIIANALISPTLICGEAEPLMPPSAFLKNESKFIATLKNCGKHLLLLGESSIEREGVKISVSIGKNLL